MSEMEDTTIFPRNTTPGIIKHTVSTISETTKQPVNNTSPEDDLNAMLQSLAEYEAQSAAVTQHQKHTATPPEYTRREYSSTSLPHPGNTSHNHYPHRDDSPWTSQHPITSHQIHHPHHEDLVSPPQHHVDTHLYHRHQGDSVGRQRQETDWDKPNALSFQMSQSYMEEGNNWSDSCDINARTKRDGRRDAKQSILEAMSAVDQFSWPLGAGENVQERVEDEEAVELWVKRKSKSKDNRFDMEALNSELANLLSMVGQPIHTAQPEDISRVGDIPRAPPPTPAASYAPSYISLTPPTPPKPPTLHQDEEEHVNIMEDKQQRTTDTKVQPGRRYTTNSTLQKGGIPKSTPTNTRNSTYLSRSLGSLNVASSTPAADYDEDDRRRGSHQHLHHHRHHNQQEHLSTQSPPSGDREEGRGGFLSQLRAMLGVREGMRSLKRRTKQKKGKSNVSQLASLHISPPHGFRHIDGASLHHQGHRIEEYEVEKESAGERKRLGDLSVNISATTSSLDDTHTATHDDNTVLYRGVPPFKTVSLTNLAMPSASSSSSSLQS